MDEEDLRALVECPVCLNTPRDTKYYSCVNGHSVCSECMTGIAKTAKILSCPTCRSPYHNPPTRNLTAEKVIRTGKLKFACKHEGSECEFRGNGILLKSHEASCDRRKMPCPSSDCIKMVTFVDLLQHIMKGHRHFKCNWGNLMWPLQKYAPGAFDWILSILEFDNRHFIIKLTRNWDWSYYSWVHLLGDEKAAADYMVGIKAVGNAWQYKKVCKVHAVDENKEDIVVDSDCFHMSNINVEQCKVKTNQDDIPFRLPVAYTIFKKSA